MSINTRKSMTGSGFGGIALCPKKAVYELRGPTARVGNWPNSDKRMCFVVAHSYDYELRATEVAGAIDAPRHRGEKLMRIFSRK